MKFFITAALLFLCLPGFTAVRNGDVDSIKNLLGASLNEKATPNPVVINQINNLAAEYFQINPDSSYYYGQKSIRLSRKINYRQGIANGLLLTGNVDYFKGNSARAIKSFDEAIVLYKSLNDLHGLSRCYVQYGRMYRVLAAYQLSLSYLSKALDISRQIKDDKTLTDCYKNIGILYYSQGKLSKALDYYYNGLYFALKNHYASLSAEIYNDIGVVLKDMEVYPNALDYYNKATAILQKIKNAQAISTINENIGEIYLIQHNYKRAISYLNKSLRITKTTDDKEGLSSDYTDLGLCYANQGRFDLAFSCLDTASQIAGKYKIVYNQAYAAIGFATAYNLAKEYRNAYRYAMLGQKLAIKLGNLAVRANAASQLNKTMAGLHKYEAAYGFLSQYNDLTAQLNNNGNIEKISSYSLTLNFADKERQMKQQRREQDLLFQQRTHTQRLTNIIFVTIIAGMLVVLGVYYYEKQKQKQINKKLEEKNIEVLTQKANLDEQAHKLNDLNKLKDRLISILAHDLRAPLSTLRGLFGLLQDNTLTLDELLEMVPNVLKKLEYTSDFLDTLLFWINSQMDNFTNAVRNFPLRDAINHEMDTYHEQAQAKGITLIDNIEEALMITADPNSIRIVIRNLITNALKFSGEGDSIQISARQEDEHTVTIRVKDTGVGMPPQQLNNLFKSKVDSTSGTKNELGTGMGLLFCKDLVEKCNGRIGVSSRQGEGTEFYITLPAAVNAYAEVK